MQDVASAGIAIRTAGRDALAAALRASRADTLAAFAAFEAAGMLDVPQRPTLNPPLWELGHIGWFQDWWIGRNPERRRGVRADPLVPRLPPARAGADALYDSGKVAHATRWSLPLPDPAATRADLAAQLETTLALLADVDDESDDALYFFRLALLHEDMHHEAALYSARALGFDAGGACWQPQPLRSERSELAFADGPFLLGYSGPGFAFDNELGAHEVALAPFRIDSRAVSGAEFDAFVDAGGWADERCWSAAGLRWRDARPAPARHDDGSAAARHRSFYEAEAWCRWAGRRLPTEAEWERAAVERPADLEWGDVWEWTAGAFAPYPGFVAHPYRDYSAPWFDGRPVLRGASFATQPRMRHPRYRNFFAGDRVDIIAGFRTCAL